MEHGRKDNPSDPLARASSPGRGDKGCGGKCRCLWCRKGQGWNIHHGFLLHLIGMKDADIAAKLGISPAAVTKRRKQKWAFGRA